jgi:hypothetical protein
MYQTWAAGQEVGRRSGNYPIGVMDKTGARYMLLVEQLGKKALFWYIAHSVNTLGGPAIRCTVSRKYTASWSLRAKWLIPSTLELPRHGKI